MNPSIVERSVDCNTNICMNSTYNTNNCVTSTLDINYVLCDQNFANCIIPIYNVNNFSGTVHISKLDRYRFPKIDPPEMSSWYKDRRQRQEIL